MIFKSVDPRELQIDTRELSARLGMPVTEADIAGSEAYRSLVAIARPTYSAVRVKLNRDNGAITVGGVRSESKALIKLCDGADESILLTATLGVGTDRLVLKRASASAYDAFMVDAIADAMIEALCDLAQAQLCEGIDASGRFSPGYGDLELSFGEVILTLTDAERLLGIKMTSGGMMIPKKSVSAIIAIKNADGRGE